MRNEAGGWSLQGPDPCAAEAGEADSEAGGEVGVVGDDEGGRSVVSLADPWHPRLLGRKKNGDEGEKKEERRGGAVS